MVLYEIVDNLSIVESWFWKRISEARQINTTNNSFPNLAHAGNIIKQDADKAVVFGSILEATFSGTTRPCDEQHIA